MYTKVVPIARLQAGAYAVPFSEYEGQSLDSVQIRDASQALLWPVSDVELDGSVRLLFSSRVTRCADVTLAELGLSVQSGGLRGARRDDAATAPGKLRKVCEQPA